MKLLYWVFSLAQIKVINKNTGMLKMNAWGPPEMALSGQCNTLRVIRKEKLCGSGRKLNAPDFNVVFGDGSRAVKHLHSVFLFP